MKNSKGKNNEGKTSRRKRNR